MKKIYLAFLGLASFIILISFVWADEPLDKLLASLEQFTTNAPQEKVYLQFDKPYYSLGEDMWVKAYVVDAERNALSNRSKILYIDLLDERDSIKKTLLLPVVNGTASANINLPDSALTAGNYHVYAYTKWMQNFSSDFFFRKSIPIVNALKGAISGNLQYKSVLTDNGKQLTSDLTFKRDNGTTYNGLPISYTITADGKTIGTGKAVTNLGGQIAIVSNIKKDYKDAVITISATLSPAGGSTSTQNFVIRPLAGTADVQFFPEGGRLVTGIRTKVAFKALKNDGMSEQISGYVTDESGEHLAEFQSEHAGMGIFALAPLSGKKYTAVVKHEDGSESRVALPDADPSGYVLNVNRIGSDSLSVRISASAALANGSEAILVAQCNGVVQFVAKPKLEGPSVVSIISTKKFPTGITQITLFSPDYKPVAERLIFVDHNDQLRSNIAADKPTYAKRGKVKLDIKVEDAYGQPVTGTFAMAVVDGGKVKMAEDDESTILSNLLLTSDIKGYIEQPNYYFNTDNANRLKHLDQLLLTQGWRRFTWTDLLANKYPAIKYQPEQSLAVTGSVTTLGNKPLANSPVNLFASTANGPIIIDTVTDANGRFIFNDLDFADSAKLLVRASKIKGGTAVKTSLDKKPRVQYAPFYDAADAVKGLNLADYIKYTQDQFFEMSKYGLMKNTTALKEVKIKAQKVYNADKIIPHSANLAPGSADIVIKKERFEQSIRFLDAFFGLPGVQVRNGQLWLVRVKSLTSAGPMLIILDGAQIPPSMSADILASLTAGDILGAELMTRGSSAIYGNDGANGVVIITSKRGGEGRVSDQNTHTQHYVPLGYATVKQFYAPEYDTPAANDKMNDLRSTIYWNPNIVTDAEGKASLTYYNADGVGNYKVTLEGMDTKGKLLRKIFTYAVK